MHWANRLQPGKNLLLDDALPLLPPKEGALTALAVAPTVESPRLRGLSIPRRQTMHTLIAIPPARPAQVPLSLREIFPWLLCAAVLLAVSVYFVGAEQGAYALLSGNGVHEFLHDGRHLLAFPCH